jgi:radical S-adenosyl methionine domain-containing protein 2
MNQQKAQAVFNLHITQKCNYGCKYCFSQWENAEEIWQENPQNVFRIIDEIADSSKLFPDFSDKPRLNFAGGEPLILGGKLIEFAKYAFEKGIDVSIITNGSLLVENKNILPYLTIVGISIDSLDGEINRKIGRCCGGKSILRENLENIVKVIQKTNPKIALKFNIVVNEWNWDMKIAPSLLEFSPQKIKILREVPFKNRHGITDKQFNSFVETNGCKNNSCIVTENSDDMINSYLMIDPSGRFFENGHENKYLYSEPIYKVGLEKSLNMIKFHERKFIERYV